MKTKASSKPARSKGPDHRSLLADQQARLAAAASLERQLRATIRNLQADCEEWDDQYQSKCRETYRLYGLLEEIQSVLRRIPPAVPAALKLIDGELES